jgi:hypothetical protein
MSTLLWLRIVNEPEGHVFSLQPRLLCKELLGEGDDLIRIAH